MQFALSGDMKEEVPTKRAYIENEIKSENFFNSPRHMGSSPLAKTPKSTHQMKEFFSSNSVSNDKNKIKERMRSPPAPHHSTPNK